MAIIPGDIVRYVRAPPGEEHLRYQVAAMKVDDEGTWVLLQEEPEDAPDVEIAPGVMGGFGGWEQVEEFEVSPVTCNQLTAVV